MPTYEYECRKCGHRFEAFGQMSDPPLRTCPRCGGRVRRLLGTGAGVIVKGSSAAAGRRPACSRERPCCGRDRPCETRPCDR